MSGRAMMLRCAVAAVLMAAGACGEEAETPTAAQDLVEMQADLVYYGMVSYLTASGVREGRVEADTAYVFTDSSKVKMRGMNLVFYTEEGRERATVRAREGELDENTDRMVARGDVVLVLNDGRRIESPELHYDPTTQRIWSDSSTVQTDPQGRVTRGSAFESDMDFRNIRIRDPRGAVSGIVF